MSVKEKKISQRYNRKEQFLKNSSGEVEFVVMPIKEYNNLISLLEDYGFGQAMKQAESEEVFCKEDALKYLASNED